MVIELLTVLLVVVSGCALLRTLGLTGWGLLPLGVLVGVYLMLGIGFLQVTTGLPTTPALTLALLPLPVLWWAWRWWRGADVRVAPLTALACLAGTGAAVAALRLSRLVTWHTDSLAYLTVSRLIAVGKLRSTVGTDLLTERVLGVPLLHAPANLSGGFYLRSITPVITAATLAAVLWYLWHGTRTRFNRGQMVTIALLAIALLLTNDRVLWHAFYINGHVLFASCLLLVVANGWLLTLGRPTSVRALLATQIVALPALVISRPEGPMAGVLALLPTLLSPRVPRRHRVATAAVLGGSIALFCGFQAWIFHERATPVPASVYGQFLLGIALLAAIPLLWWSLLTRHTTRLLWGTEALIWLSLLALAVHEPHTLRASLHATRINQLDGDGGWGDFIAVVCVLLLVAMLLIRIPGQAYLRFPITSFVPFVFILTYLRGGAYRIGPGDSLNRMVMHILPLALLLLLALLTGGRWPGERPEDDIDAADRQDAPAGHDSPEPAAVPAPAAELPVPAQRRHLIRQPR